MSDNPPLKPDVTPAIPRNCPHRAHWWCYKCVVALHERLNRLPAADETSGCKEGQ